MSEASKFNLQNIIATLDVESLFTNILLEETINNMVIDLFFTTDKIHNFEREEIKQLLTFASFESFFIFDGEHYTQINGIAMGSSLGPTLANASLCHLEKKQFSECHCKIFGNFFCLRYVDDIFVSFDSYTHLLEFVDYMNH